MRSIMLVSLAALGALGACDKADKGPKSMEQAKAEAAQLERPEPGQILISGNQYSILLFLKMLKKKN